MSFGKRPELTAPPDIFYNETEAKKYTQNSRVIEIQQEMTERAIQLLELPNDEPLLLLDLGCGSGLSGSVLDDQEHIWVGMDISSAMLDVARVREVDGDLIMADIGQGVHFRPGCFDGAISISALQWLCNADKSSHRPARRLYTFFSTLYSTLNSGRRAVLQFYPADDKQKDLILFMAKRAGFNGGLVIDYPESAKSRKYYLVLTVGSSRVNHGLPKALTYAKGDTVNYASSDNPSSSKGKRGRSRDVKSVKDWVQDKKERRRRQGKDTRPDSKYTGRKRSSKF